VVRVEQLNAELMPLAARYREIGNQVQSLPEGCKDQLKDESCIDSDKKLLIDVVEVTNSIIPLLDEKIALLNAAPQNAWIRAEKEESIPMLDGMKTENQSASAILANLGIQEGSEAHDASTPMECAVRPNSEGMVACEARLHPPSAMPATVEARSTSSSLSSTMINAKLKEMDSEVTASSDRFISLKEECAASDHQTPAADRNCLQRQRQAIVSASQVFESYLSLFDEKIAWLEFGPQDSESEQEEKDAVAYRNGAKTNLLALSQMLADIDKRFTELSQPGESNDSRPNLMAVSQPSQPVLPGSNSTNSGLDLRRMDDKLLELNSAGQELSAQWAQFQKDCPDPTTDEICLEDKRQVTLVKIENTKSRIQLIDQKISLLDAGPQDVLAQQVEDESAKKREELNTALRTFPGTLANLDKSLAEAKQATANR